MVGQREEQGRDMSRAFAIAFLVSTLSKKDKKAFARHISGTNKETRKSLVRILRNAERFPRRP